MEEGMERIRNLWEKAFELGYFIHRDRHLTRQIVIEAMDRWETAAVHQAKRRSYRLLGRGRLRPRRDKVMLEQASLLQYLIYRESELRELEQERQPGGARLTDEDKIVRFIEHLGRITLPRNAFHVCIGIGRLLYRYTTDELTKLYDVLIQDVEGYRGGDYVRARKKVLIDDVLRRFGSQIRLRTGAHGEKIFQTRPCSESLARGVHKALRMFSPWGTSCSLPKDLEPSRHVVPELRFDGPDPDEEHAHELRRMHAVLHPPCFAELVGALGFEAPEKRLAVPIFFADSTPNGNGDEDPGARGRLPSPLTVPERRQMENELRIRDQRRAAWKLGKLSVLVDGTEVGALALPMMDRRRFQLPADAGMVEVRGEHNHHPVRLATYLPDWSASQEAGESSVEVELAQGQIITFAVPSPAIQTGTKTIEIRYRETRRLRALALAWHRSWFGLQREQARKRWLPVLAAVGATMLAVGVGFLVLPSPPDPQSPLPFPERIRIEPGSPSPDTPTKARPRTGATDFPLRDPVRGSSDSQAGVPLSEVKILHIQTFDTDSQLRALHERLAERLGEGNRFQVTAEPGKADAVLRLSEQDETVSPGDTSENEPRRRARTPLVLVNRGGEILWREGLHPPFEEGTEARARRVAESLIAIARQSP